MCYFRRKECEWNDTRTYGFHAAWKRYPGTFTLPADHNYWKLSGKTVGVSTCVGASEGSGVGTQAQIRLALSEVILRHQGEANNATFYSFLTELSKVLNYLK